MVSKTRSTDKAKVQLSLGPRFRGDFLEWKWERTLGVQETGRIGSKPPHPPPKVSDPKSKSFRPCHWPRPCARTQ